MTGAEISKPQVFPEIRQFGDRGFYRAFDFRGKNGDAAFFKELPELIESVGIDQ